MVAKKKAVSKRKTKQETAAAKRKKPTIEKAVKAVIADAKARLPKKSSARPKVEQVDLSLVDAAAVVLADHANGLKARDLFDEITKRGLWSTDKGKTPHQTLAAALSRLIDRNGKSSRFVRLERGVFGLRGD